MSTSFDRQKIGFDLPNSQSFSVTLNRGGLIVAVIQGELQSRVLPGFPVSGRTTHDAQDEQTDR